MWFGIGESKSKTAPVSNRWQHMVVTIPSVWLWNVGIFFRRMPQLTVDRVRPSASASVVRRPRLLRPSVRSPRRVDVIRMRKKREKEEGEEEEEEFDDGHSRRCRRRRTHTTTYRSFARAGRVIACVHDSREPDFNPSFSLSLTVSLARSVSQSDRQTD